MLHLLRLHISRVSFFIILRSQRYFSFFFFNDTATTEIYTLSLHDALPISRFQPLQHGVGRIQIEPRRVPLAANPLDRKSTRLNSSHGYISYAVFCLKKKKKKQT